MSRYFLLSWFGSVLNTTDILVLYLYIYVSNRFEHFVHHWWFQNKYQTGDFVFYPQTVLLKMGLACWETVLSSVNIGNERK